MKHNTRPADENTRPRDSVREWTAVNCVRRFNIFWGGLEIVSDMFNSLGNITKLVRHDIRRSLYQF